MIAQELADPAAAHLSAEEQRRRILLALEAPLKPPTRPAGAPAGLTARQRRIAALRRSIPLERDMERRMDLTDQLRELAAAEAADPGPQPAAPHGPGPGTPTPTPRRRFVVAVPPPPKKP